MAATVPLPAVFLERMSRFLGDDFPAFVRALDDEPVGGLRLNTLKLSIQEFIQRVPFPLGESVPWCDSAFLVEGEGKLGKHPWHLAGVYYLQDPSAMAPAVLLAPQPGERVLDLAASPGGKTTQLAALMQGKGLLVANEIKDKRLGHLVMNVERWGARNTVVTNVPPERLADTFGAWFDRVLVDAPCSGEGMFRKDMAARQDWSMDMIAGYALKQRNILRVAGHLVRPGGFLLYSTCTFAPEENESVVSGFLIEHPDFHVEPIQLAPGFSPGHPEWLPGQDASLKGAVRLFPHRLSGDGHFICLLKREQSGIRVSDRLSDNTLPDLDPEQIKLWAEFSRTTLAMTLPSDRLRLRGERLYFLPDTMPDFGNVRVVHPGIWVGSFKTGRFEPAHPLALTLKLEDCANGVNFSAEDPSLERYLRGESLPSQGDAGWVLVCVDGFGLGWGKRVQGRLKNHYPRGWL